MTDPTPWSHPDGTPEPERAPPPQPEQGWAPPPSHVPPQGHNAPPPPPGYDAPPLPQGYNAPPPLPGYGAPPPSGYGALPPSGYGGPPRKSRTGLWIGLAIGAFVLVCCIGVPAVVGGAIYVGYQMDKRDTVSAFEDYLEAVKAEDHETAYDMLCDEDRRGFDVDEYVARASDGPRLVSYDIGDARMWDGENLETGYEIDVELTWDNGDVENAVYAVYTTDLDLYDYEVCRL